MNAALSGGMCGRKPVSYGGWKCGRSDDQIRCCLQDPVHATQTAATSEFACCSDCRVSMCQNVYVSLKTHLRPALYQSHACICTHNVSHQRAVHALVARSVFVLYQVLTAVIDATSGPRRLPLRTRLMQAAGRDTPTRQDVSRSVLATLRAARMGRGEVSPTCCAVATKCSLQDCLPSPHIPEVWSGPSTGY